MRPFLFLLGAVGLAFVGAVSCGDTFSSPGTGGSGGSSVGKPCDTVADCDAPSSACVNVTCQVNRCVETALGDGPLPAGQQQAGDCHKLTCQNGVVDNQVDTSDVPVDGNDCTADVCNEGMPSNPLQPMDTPCGNEGVLHCDSAGNCAGCESAENCGSNKACVTYECLANQTCKTVFVDQGTVLDPSFQTDGDCNLLVCNGSGAEVSVPDDDPPMSVADGCELKVCLNGMVDTDTIANSMSCVGSTTRVCCNAVCCQTGDTCGAQGCQGGAGGAGGGGN